MKLLGRLIRQTEPRQDMTRVVETWAGQRETLDIDFRSFVEDAYHSSGLVFACILARMMLFTEARFRYRDADLILSSTPVGLLERPWLNATTGDLLARMELHASLAGNAYVHRISVDRLRMLRPDWVQLLVGDDQIVFYVYWPGGRFSGSKPELLDPAEVAHYAPTPDPLKTYAGSSWLRAAAADIIGDKHMTRHKTRFFENAASPNIAVTYKGSLGKDARQRLKDQMAERHTGVENAYKTLFLDEGADVKVVGQNFEQMDFKVVQGHAETRVAAAAQVPPIIVGLSEGLSSATYSNYGLAMRRFTDLTIRPLWRQAAGALASILPRRAGMELWYDDRNIPALQQDAKDDADVLQTKASAYETFIRAGVRPESAAKMVGLPEIDHSGLVSVQLQPAGVNNE